jgi:hypothetical protein
MNRYRVSVSWPFRLVNVMVLDWVAEFALMLLRQVGGTHKVVPNIRTRRREGKAEVRDWFIAPSSPKLTIMPATMAVILTNRKPR